MLWASIPVFEANFNFDKLSVLSTPAFQQAGITSGIALWPYFPTISVWTGYAAFMTNKLAGSWLNLNITSVPSYDENGALQRNETFIESALGISVGIKVKPTVRLRILSGIQPLIEFCYLSRANWWRFGARAGASLEMMLNPKNREALLINLNLKSYLPFKDEIGATWEGLELAGMAGYKARLWSLCSCIWISNNKTNFGVSARVWKIWAKAIFAVLPTVVVECEIWKFHIGAGTTLGLGATGWVSFCTQI